MKRGWAAMLAGVVTAAAVALGAVSADAQRAGDFVRDLCDNDVTFENAARDDGFLTDRDLQELDRVTARLQGSEGFYKVVVLAEPVSEASSNNAFADDVLGRLGGPGRVVVFDPTDTAVASNLDSTGEIRAAEGASVQTANASQSLAQAAQAAAASLGVDGSGEAARPTACAPSGGSAGGGTPSSDNGVSSGLIWLVIIGLFAIGGLMLFVFMSSRKKAGSGPTGGATLGVGERKVRAEVDRASNLIIELSDAVDGPTATPEATRAYSEGASMFAELQDDLEDADTSPELEAVYPKLVECGWKLDTAKALLAGEPAPAKPDPGPLFPPLVVPTYPAPAPGAAQAPGTAPMPVPPPGSGYQSYPSSPWLSTAAMAAMTILASRGMGGSGRSYRPPSDGAMFGGMGAGRGVGGRGRGINMGGGGGGRSRGVGRRR